MGKVRGGGLGCTRAGPEASDASLDGRRCGGGGAPTTRLWTRGFLPSPPRGLGLGGVGILMGSNRGQYSWEIDGRDLELREGRAAGLLEGYALRKVPGTHSLPRPLPPPPPWGGAVATTGRPSAALSLRSYTTRAATFAAPSRTQGCGEGANHPPPFGNLPQMLAVPDTPSPQTLPTPCQAPPRGGGPKIGFVIPYPPPEVRCSQLGDARGGDELPGQII